ncbi:MAG: DHA2 family multidrug resistance protein [Gammaproteobacteria bacterium]
MTSDKIEAYIAQLDTTDAIKSLFRHYGIGYAWFAMGTVTFAMLATLLSGTIVNVAIPRIMGAFGIGQDEAQWLSTANLAAATVGMLLTSWMTQTWGIRAVVFWSMIAFFIASFVGGISPNVEFMVLARVVQGVTTGILTPLSIYVIFLLFPFERQGMVMGVSSIGVMLAPALGPTIGGMLTDSFNWRYVYFLCMVFPVVCIPLALLFLPNRDGPKPNIPFDWLGMICLSVAITLIFMGLSNGGKEGWDSTLILSYFGGAFISSVVFIYWQIRNPKPLLNLAIFRHYRFVIYSITAFAFGAGLYGSTYLIPLFLQLIQGLTPTDSGLATMPAGILMGVVAPLCGRMSDKYDPGVLIGFGSILFFLSFYLMVGSDANTSFWTFAWWMCIGRIGIGFAFPPMSMGAVRSVPAAMMSEASGVLNFVRQMGGAFGVNLSSLILARRTEFHLDAIYSTQRYDNSTTMDALAIIRQQLTVTGLPEVEQTMVAMQYLARGLHTQASVIAFKDSFLVSSFLFLFILIPAYLIWKSGRNLHPETGAK